MIFKEMKFELKCSMFLQTDNILLVKLALLTSKEYRL